MIYNLAGGDLLKFDSVLELTVDTCFNYIAYTKDLSYIQNKK